MSYLSKAARIIVNYCLNNDIGRIVLGYNEDFQRKSNIGSINNQNFVNIPYRKLRDKLIYLCKLYGIEFKLQEEIIHQKQVSLMEMKFQYMIKRIRKNIYQ